MKNDFLLNNKLSKKLYSAVCDLPIIDYHCHLPAKEIFEDKPFDNIGEIWLKYDHYKWRLMRSAGIDEQYITGNASFHDKFLMFIKAIEYAAGNPLYHWCMMELSLYFNINIPLISKNAELIWNRANAYIKRTAMSPRKLITKSKVLTLCTTDDIADELLWHKKLEEDNGFYTAVLPSFRTDNLLLMRRDGYLEYINKLSEITNTDIKDLESLKSAVSKRLDYFKAFGTRFTDVGIMYFPDRIFDDSTANDVFLKVLSCKSFTNEEYFGLLGNLYLFLAKEYKKRNLVMQLHLGVTRNSNTALFNTSGADCGCDCVGDQIVGADLIRLFDTLNSENALPETILYTLNNGNVSQLASIVGAYRNVRLGAAWWFCDNKRGIEEQLDVIAENTALGEFLGMLTDSRSFLSYARHDYFRRILCSKLSEYVLKEEFPKETAYTLAEKISFTNIKEFLGVKL